MSQPPSGPPTPPGMPPGPPPGALPPGPPPGFPPAPAPAPAPAPGPGPRSRLPLAIAGGALGVLLIGGVATAVIVSTSGDDEEPCGDAAAVRLVCAEPEDEKDDDKDDGEQDDQDEDAGGQAEPAPAPAGTTLDRASLEVAAEAAAQGYLDGITERDEQKAQSFACEGMNVDISTVPEGSVYDIRGVVVIGDDQASVTVSTEVNGTPTTYIMPLVIEDGEWCVRG